MKAFYYHRSLFLLENVLYKFIDATDYNSDKMPFLLGETFRSLSFQYRMGERTISEIVEETCQALYGVMKDKYLKV